MKNIFKYILCFVAICFVSFNFISVKASATVTLTEGVSVRTNGDNGLKFQATVSDAVSGATYGMLFIRGIVNDFDSLISGVVSAEVDSLNEYNKFCVTMVKFPQAFYAQNISVRAYIKVNDEYPYSPNIVICNLYEKAVKLLSSNNYVESEIIEEIINNTYVKFMAFTGMDTTLHSQMVSDFINDFNTYNEINVSIDEFFGNTYGKVTSSTLYAFLIHQIMLVNGSGCLII